MKFDIAANNHRYDFIRSDTLRDGCAVLYFVFRFALNTLVLTAVLAWIDFYFNQSASVSLRDLVMHDLRLVLIGLIAIPLAYPIAFAAGIGYWAVTKADAYRYLGIVALLLSGAVIVIVKYHFIARLGLAFAYPAAIVVAQAFIVLSLRSYVEKYGVSCRDLPA